MRRPEQSGDEAGHGPSRRKIVKGIFAAAVVGSVGEQMAQAQTSSTSTTKSTQAVAASAPAATQASNISPDDVAVLERILGFHYTDADRKLMAADLPGNRKRLLGFRNRT